MFGIGMPEFILIAVVALIVFGPKKLPDLAKSMGKAVREFKKATSELKETMQVDTELTEVKQAFSELHSEVNKSIRHEADRPAAAPSATDPAASVAAPAQPTATAPADDSVEPSAEAKLEELKKAFDAWNAAKPAPAPGAEPAAAPEPRKPS
jgi:TatA/E family protein of Tat protein translocase